MGTAAVATIFSTYTGNIGTDLTNNLPLVLGIAAGLISLCVLMGYVARWISDDGGTSIRAQKAIDENKKILDRMS